MKDKTTPIEQCRADHYDTLTLAREEMGQLEALFHSIFLQCTEHDSRKGLAGVGMYLTQGWANDFDCEAESLKGEIDNG